MEAYEVPKCPTCRAFHFPSEPHGLDHVQTQAIPIEDLTRCECGATIGFHMWPCTKKPLSDPNDADSTEEDYLTIDGYIYPNRPLAKVLAGVLNDFARQEKPDYIEATRMYTNEDEWHKAMAAYHILRVLHPEMK